MKDTAFLYPVEDAVDDMRAEVYYNPVGGIVVAAFLALACALSYALLAVYWAVDLSSLAWGMAKLIARV